MFRGISSCIVGNGSTVLFWSDVWNHHLLQEKFPRLYSYAKDKRISVAKFLENNIVMAQFHLPLSEQAHQEHKELQGLLQNIQVQEHSKDTWHYIWGTSTCTSSKFYNFQYKNVSPHAPFLWIWKSKCIPRIKFFT